MNIQDPNKYIPASKAAKLLGISRQRVYHLINRGSLNAIYSDNKVKVLESSVLARKNTPPIVGRPIFENSMTHAAKVLKTSKTTILKLIKSGELLVDNRDKDPDNTQWQINQESLMKLKETYSPKKRGRKPLVHLNIPIGPGLPLNQRQAAKLINISRPTIRLLIKKGHIKSNPGFGLDYQSVLDSKKYVRTKKQITQN